MLTDIEFIFCFKVIKINKLFTQLKTLSTIILLNSAYASPEKYEPFSIRGKHWPKPWKYFVRSCVTPFTVNRLIHPLKSSFLVIISRCKFGAFSGKPPIKKVFEAKNFFGIFKVFWPSFLFFPLTDTVNVSKWFLTSIAICCHWPLLDFIGTEISSRFRPRRIRYMLPFLRYRYR